MRIKGGVTRHKKHKKIKNQAKGFRGHRRRSVKGAKEGILHALANAYIGRKHKKRNMRRLWITRLNAALRNQGLSYSGFINILKTKSVLLDRKVLSTIAQHDPDTFTKITAELTSTKEVAKDKDNN